MEAGIYEYNLRKYTSFTPLDQSSYLDWLKLNVNKNISESTGSKFWINKSKKEGFNENDINKASSIEELLSIVGNADYSLLTDPNGYVEWYKPKSVDVSDLYRSDSSGTTGPAKTVYHDSQSLLISAINEFSGILYYMDSKDKHFEYKNDKFLIAFGPLGAYQKEHEYLAKILNLNYINLGFDTRGLKIATPDEVQRRIYPSFKKALEYINDDKVALITTSKEVIPMFGEALNKVDMIKISGTGITYEQVKQFEESLPSTLVIPSYGHFAAKSSIGFLNNSKITYYPSFPATNFFVVDDNGKIVPYGKEGKIKMVIAQPSVLLIKEDDIAERAKPNEVFGVDGVSNPHR